MDDTEEGFVARKEASSSGDGVALEHSLAGMFGKDLDDATSLCARGDIPLKVAAGCLEHGVKFVGNKFIRGEDSESGWVPAIFSSANWKRRKMMYVLFNNLLQKASNHLHATFLRSFLDAIILPIGGQKGLICSITFLPLAELLLVGDGDDAQDCIDGHAALCKEFLRLI